MSTVTQFSNTSVTTTLNGAITDSQTDLDVDSDTGYPAVPFNIEIDDEVIRVTARTTTDFSVIVRGYDGTSGAAHSDAAVVNHVVVAEDIGGTVKTWTPTFVNFTLGNGSLDARYQIVGNVMWYYISVQLGSTSSMGSNPTMTLPPNVTAAMPSRDLLPHNNNVGIATFRDEGVRTYVGHVHLATATTFGIRVNSIITTYLRNIGISAIIPMTWAVNDRFVATGSIQVT